MTHRRRGMLFGVAAIGAGLIAATTVARHEQSTASGPDLVTVVVARQQLAPGKAILARELELRRFPRDFVPGAVLGATAAAVGRRPAALIPAGAYVLAPQLRSTRRPAREGRRNTSPGRVPIEIGVVGASAMRHSGPGGMVDVLVTHDSPRGLGGRARTLAAGAELIALEPGSGPDASKALLEVDRAEVLSLIEADAYAREIRLIPAREGR